METPAMPPTVPAPPADGGPVPCVAGETMLRVHEQLRRGAAPSYEAMLAFGEPNRRLYPAA